MLDPDDTAPRHARDATRDSLARWELRHLTDDAQAITSELTANAAAASRRIAVPGTDPAAITFWLAVQDGELLMRVWDPDPAPRPATCRHPAPATRRARPDDHRRPRRLVGLDPRPQRRQARPRRTQGGRRARPGPGYAMTETMLARLQREHAGRWEVWTVWTAYGPAYWCTRPAGEPAAVHETTTGEHMEAFLCQATALTGKGVTFAYHRNGALVTATATWASPGTGTPQAYGPAPVPQVITHAENQLRKARTP
jgi:hypothetical protein